MSTTQTTAQTFLNEHGLELYNQNMFHKIANDIREDINQAKYDDSELREKINESKTEISEMAGNISNNSAAISELMQFIGELPAETAATTVIEYINSKVEDPESIHQCIPISDEKINALFN